ncbi:MAG: family 78 glycoside hydrolase catalytic domain, partial [Mycobacteriales bacterium]
HVTALGLIEPWLNGTRVGDEVLAPGWTSYSHRLAVSSFDITPLMHEGINAVGAVLGDGWAVGRVGWEGRRQVWAERPAGFVQLDLEDEQGARTVGTDSTWRAGVGGVRANSLFDGEAFDARLEPEGWSQPGFDDASWQPVVPVEIDLSALVPRTWEPIRRVEELAANAVLTTPSGRTVVDFGQNISGWVRLRVSGPAGTAITLRHSETLVHGEIDFETNRGAAATDTYVLRGGGEEVWEPRFTFHGFRYVDVEGWPGPLKPEDLTGVVIHSDMRRTGWFETSDPMLNQLHSNVVWSMRDNFVGVPTDCPQRDERAGWTGDINAFAPTAAFLYDVRGVLGSWLEDLAIDQQVQGAVPFVVPDVMTRPAPPTALWGDVAVNLPWVLYQEFGDLDVLRRQYPSMTAYVDQVEKLLDDSGLWSTGYQFGDWLDPDAPPTNAAGGKTDAHLVASALFCRTTRQLADTAAVLGIVEDARRYEALHDRVRGAFRHEWVTPSGRLANESQTAYALAICFGILDEAQVARAGARLAALVEAAGHHIATGFAGTPFVAHALTRAGHVDVAYRLLQQTECPSFLYPLSQGATTIWERWDAITPEGSLNSTGMTSLNHYALGAIADWLHRVVGGLSPVTPGYGSIRIEPKPGGGLTRAVTTKDTPHGRVTVRWNDHEGTRTVEVVMPAGSTAVVVLPDHPEELVESVSQGTHTWTYTPRRQHTDELTLDTPMSRLMQSLRVWDAVRAVFVKHFPEMIGQGENAGDVSAFGSTLREVLRLAPTRAVEIENDLVAVLAEHRPVGSPE